MPRKQAMISAEGWAKAKGCEAEPVEMMLLRGRTSRRLDRDGSRTYTIVVSCGNINRIWVL